MTEKSIEDRIKEHESKIVKLKAIKEKAQKSLDKNTKKIKFHEKAADNLRGKLIAKNASIKPVFQQVNVPVAQVV